MRDLLRVMRESFGKMREMRDERVKELKPYYLHVVSPKRTDEYVRYGKDKDDVMKWVNEELELARFGLRDPDDNYMQRGYPMNDLMFFVYDVSEEDMSG